MSEFRPNPPGPVLQSTLMAMPASLVAAPAICSPIQPEPHASSSTAPIGRGLVRLPPRSGQPKLSIVGNSKAKASAPETPSNDRPYPGLKRSLKQTSRGVDPRPPTPWGCEWRQGDEGWDLWRCWSEKDPLTGSKIRKNRYAGHLSRSAWEVMREYEYEAFLSIIGQRFRRYGKR